jgi:hypothetical protein
VRPVSNILLLAAEDPNLVREGYGGLIFMGVFALVLIGFAVWWLSRG